MSARPCAHAIEAATTTRDLDGLFAVYADDVVVNSPVAAVQFRGKSPPAAAEPGSARQVPLSEGSPVPWHPVTG